MPEEDVAEERRARMSAEGRIEWIDIAKGIAMVSVVMCHVENDWYDPDWLSLKVLLWGWNVPVFFLLAGFFIREERLRSPLPFVKGKVRSIYLKLLMYYVPFVLLHNVFIDIGFYDTATEYGGKAMTYYDVAETLKKLAAAACLAGREPLLAPLWFVSVLFMAMVCLSVGSRILWRWTGGGMRYEFVRMMALMALCMMSCALTNLFDITIPRGNNTMTALWLLYCGYMLRGRLRWEFDNGMMAAACALVVYHCASVEGGVILAANDYDDCVLLTVASVAALYLTCYLSRHIEGTRVGAWLALCGRESFALMALQFVGFRVGTLLLRVVGVDRPLGALWAPAKGSIVLFVYYVTAGVMVPLALVGIYRIVRRRVAIIRKGREG